jgi:hypothetical protein
MLKGAGLSDADWLAYYSTIRERHDAVRCSQSGKVKKHPPRSS